MLSGDPPVYSKLRPFLLEGYGQFCHYFIRPFVAAETSQKSGNASIDKLQLFQQRENAPHVGQSFFSVFLANWT